MPVKETDRAEFEAFGDLGFDGDGREVLVGLSYEETEWYLDVLERDRLGRGLITEAENDRRNDLDDRHAMVRRQIAAAEYEMRSEAPLGRQSWLTGKSNVPAIRAGAVAMSRTVRGRGGARQGQGDTL
jgi:hypothetical protein